MMVLVSPVDLALIGVDPSISRCSTTLLDLPALVPLFYLRAVGSPLWLMLSISGIYLSILCKFLKRSPVGGNLSVLIVRIYIRTQ